MITLDQIAELCKVSKMTASRALDPNSRSKVAKPTRSLVLEVAAKYNYRQNKVVKAFASGRTHLIGFIGFDFSRQFQGEVFGGVQEVVNPLGYDILTLQWSEIFRDKEKLMCSLVDRRVEGVLAFHSDPHGDFSYLMDLQKHGVSVVVLDRAVSISGVSYVVPDNVSGSIQAVNCLVELGHESIAYVTWQDDGVLDDDRYLGYRLAMKQHKLRSKEKIVIPSKALEPEIDGKWFEKFMKDSKSTAIVTLNDLVALSFYSAAQIVGFSIPCDLSIVGFGNSKYYAKAFSPRLTTIDLGAKKVGQEGAKMLLSNIESKFSKKKITDAASIVLPVSLIERNSTCPAGAK